VKILSKVVGFRLFLAAVEEMGCATFKKRQPYCVADKVKIRDKGRTKKRSYTFLLIFFLMLLTL
jgi:hypothetical protein